MDLGLGLMPSRPKAGLLLFLYVLYLLEPGAQDFWNAFSDAGTMPRSFLDDDDDDQEGTRAIRTRS